MGILANWKKVVTVDKIFEILKSVHEGARAHTGYHKLYKDIEQTYYGIPRKLVWNLLKAVFSVLVRSHKEMLLRLSPSHPNISCTGDS